MSALAQASELSNIVYHKTLTEGSLQVGEDQHQQVDIYNILSPGIERGRRQQGSQVI